MMMMMNIATHLLQFKFFILFFIMFFFLYVFGMMMMVMKMVRNIIKREEKLIMKKIPLHRVDEKKSLHFSALFTILVERRKIMMEKIFLLCH